MRPAFLPLYTWIEAWAPWFRAFCIVVGTRQKGEMPTFRRVENKKIKRHGRSLMSDLFAFSPGLHSNGPSLAPFFALFTASPGAFLFRCCENFDFVYWHFDWKMSAHNNSSVPKGIIMLLAMTIWQLILPKLIHNMAMGDCVRCHARSRNSARRTSSSSGDLSYHAKLVCDRRGGADQNHTH